MRDDEQLHVVVKVNILNQTIFKSVEHKEKGNLRRLSEIAEFILLTTAKNLNGEFPITFNVITLELVMLSSKEVEIICVADKKRIIIPLYVNECSFRYQGMSRVLDCKNLAILLSTLPLCKITTDLL